MKYLMMIVLLITAMIGGCIDGAPLPGGTADVSEDAPASKCVPERSWQESCDAPLGSSLLQSLGYWEHTVTEVRCTTADGTVTVETHFGECVQTHECNPYLGSAKFTFPCVDENGLHGEQTLRCTKQGEWLDDTCHVCNPEPEVCDDVDNDCDGETDEDLDLGLCTATCGEPAERVCAGGQEICPESTPTDEICDGYDNDCNGIIDDAPPVDILVVLDGSGSMLSESEAVLDMLSAAAEEFGEANVLWTLILAPMTVTVDTATVKVLLDSGETDAFLAALNALSEQSDADPTSVFHGALEPLVDALFLTFGGNAEEYVWDAVGDGSWPISSDPPKDNFEVGVQFSDYETEKVLLVITDDYPKSYLNPYYIGTEDIEPLLSVHPHLRRWGVTRPQDKDKWSPYLSDGWCEISESGTAMLSCLVEAFEDLPVCSPAP